MRQVNRGRAIAALVAVLAAAPPASHAAGARIPNLSGNWGRNWLFFEPASGVSAPVGSRIKRADGTMNIEIMAGDDTNPILTPLAREVLRTRAEISRNAAAPDPHNQCAPEPTPFTLGTQFGVEIVQSIAKCFCCLSLTTKCAA